MFRNKSLTKKMDNKLWRWGFAASFTLGAYIFLVATFLRFAEELFGDGPNILGIIAFLFLFVISAAISSALVLGKPAQLYFDGKKKEGLALFGITLGWMAFFMVAFFAAMAILK